MDDPAVEGEILVRTKSHRARRSAESTLGYWPREWFSLHFNGHFIWVTQGEWEKIKNIKGIGKARVDITKLRMCWKKGVQY